jgi:hypothetical protein
MSALQFYDSLKTPSVEDFVGLHCLVGCTVRAAEGVGTSLKSSYTWYVVQIVICVVNQSILFQTGITNVFKVCSTACEACAWSFLYFVCILWRFTCEYILNMAGSISAWWVDILYLSFWSSLRCGAFVSEAIVFWHNEESLRLYRM